MTQYTSIQMEGLQHNCWAQASLLATSSQSLQSHLSVDHDVSMRDSSSNRAEPKMNGCNAGLFVGQMCISRAQYHTLLWHVLAFCFVLEHACAALAIPAVKHTVIHTHARAHALSFSLTRLCACMCVCVCSWVCVCVLFSCMFLHFQVQCVAVCCSVLHCTAQKHTNAHDTYTKQTQQHARAACSLFYKRTHARTHTHTSTHTHTHTRVHTCARMQHARSTVTHSCAHHHTHTHTHACTWTLAHKHTYAGGV